MAVGKSIALIFLSIFLSTHLIAAYRQKDVTISKAEEVPGWVESLSFSQLIQLLLFAALDAIDTYLETFISETTHFVDGLLGDLQSLPDKNDYVQGLITELTGLLNRLTVPALSDKTPLIADIATMYSNFYEKLNTSNDSISTNLLRSVISKHPLSELSLAVENSMLNSTLKFSVLYEAFWNLLSEAQKKDHPDLNEWFEEFKMPKSGLEKINCLNKFLDIGIEEAKRK